jgi:hypothetical protein
VLMTTCPGCSMGSVPSRGRCTALTAMGIVNMKT